MFVPRLAPIALAALVTACAATPTDRVKGVAQFADDPRLGEETDRVCFQRTIDNFTLTTRDTVVLEAGPSRQYLVEVVGVCSDLDHAQSIGIDAATSCLTRGDALIVSRSPFSLNDPSNIGPQRCLIKAIYDWDGDAEAPDEPEEEAAEAATDA